MRAARYGESGPRRNREGAFRRRLKATVPCAIFMAFALLLFTASATGFALYAATGSAAVEWLLPAHLGSVLTFFLLTHYSKMVHGFYRLAALAKDSKREP